MKTKDKVRDNRGTVLSTYSYMCLVVQELQPWVSGDDGFVVFTLGSMISSLPEDIAAIFLEAFRQIPQKVDTFYIVNI